MVGTFAPQGPIATAAGGDVIVLPLPVAMKAFGTPGRVDRIAVLLAKDANCRRWLTKFREPAPEGTAQGARGERRRRREGTA